jgi:hypothetical protein
MVARALKPVPLPPADAPGAFDIADAAAIQAIYRGTATEAQQIRGMNWIIQKAAMVGGQSYRPDSHATAFIDGRRHVGIQLIAIANLDLSKLKDER